MPKLKAADYWWALEAGLKGQFPKGNGRDTPWLGGFWVARTFELVEPNRVTTVQLQGNYAPLFLSGHHVLVMTSTFRGFVPGKERERNMPWFILAPKRGSVVTHTWQPEEEVLEMAKANRGRAVVPERVPGLPHEMLVGASYPAAEAALRTDPWRERWQHWDQLTPTSSTERVPPLFFGEFGEATLALTIDPARPVSEYVDLVQEFLGALQAMESAFEAPSLAETPPSIRLLSEPRIGGEEHLACLTVTCPSCRKNALAEFTGDPVYNILCAECRHPLFAGPKAQP